MGSDAQPYVSISISREVAPSATDRVGLFGRLAATTHASDVKTIASETLGAHFKETHNTVPLSVSITVSLEQIDNGRRTTTILSDDEMSSAVPEDTFAPDIKDILRGALIDGSLEFEEVDRLPIWLHT